MLRKFYKALAVVAIVCRLASAPGNLIKKANTSIQKLTLMKTTNLIKGTLSPNEAEDILLDMTDSKINFHKIKSLSTWVRSNQPNHESELRIKELKEAREQILALIKSAKEQDSTLRIDSSLYVTLESNELADEGCPKAKDCWSQQTNSLIIFATIAKTELKKRSRLNSIKNSFFNYRKGMNQNMRNSSGKR